MEAVAYDEDDVENGVDDKNIAYEDNVGAFVDQVIPVCVDDELMVATFNKVMATNVKSIESLTQKMIAISAWVFEDQTMKLPRRIFYGMIDVLRNKSAMLMIAGSVIYFHPIAYLFLSPSTLVSHSPCRLDTICSIFLIKSCCIPQTRSFSKENQLCQDHQHTTSSNNCTISTIAIHAWY
jgi:hypothetical protein